jgi:glycosyltransferase involved in cell wall biosynthesis
MRTIVHVTCDFPDPLVPAKTYAVKNQIENAPQYRHVVYSLNRVNGRIDIASLEFGPDRIAVAYGAPRYGLFLATFLEKVADFILQDIRARNLQVDCLHLHKFAVEGLVGLRLADALGCPFISNIWGDTDLRVTQGRPDLTGRWKELLQRAAVIVPCAPWNIDRFDKLFGLDRSKIELLPLILVQHAFQPSKPTERPHLVSVMNLNSYRRKNFGALVGAVADLGRTRPDIRLSVYGACSPAVLLELHDIVRGMRAQDLVSFEGPLPNNRVIETLNPYSAFVMPTRRETFGMVFIEALFAGLPVLHSRGWGIDGYFDNDAIGYACNPSDPDDIRRGLEHVIVNQAALKQSVSSLHAAGAFNLFKHDNMVAAYERVLARAFASAS